MLRAPIGAAFFVLAALAFLSTAARPVPAPPSARAFQAENVSVSGCPWLDGEGWGALPEGHPPVARDRLPPGHPPLDGHRASRLPPGHPPVGGAPSSAPRFDKRSIVDI